MNLDVDFLIDFFNKHSGGGFKDEIDEQDAGATTTAPSGGGGGGSVPKWADSYPLKRGKSNPLMKSGEKWNTGLTRGSANQIW
jgi:hypothetical protein